MKEMERRAIAMPRLRPRTKAARKKMVKRKEERRLKKKGGHGMPLTPR